MSRGYAFGGEKAQKMSGIVRARVKDNLAQVVADGMPVMEAGVWLGLTRGQTARLWANIKAGLGEQAQ